MADLDAKIDAPAGRGFLSRLPERDRAGFLALLRPQSFGANEVIVAADDATAALYLVQEGQAVVALYSEDGKAVFYRDLVPGDIFGELSALDGLPRSAFVTARQKVRVGVLDRNDLDRLLDSHPAIARAMMLHLAEQMRRMTERLFEYRTLLVRERLIHELVRRGREIDRQSDRVVIPTVPTHFELASHIGTHREAVTKELGQLVQAGLVAKSGHGIVLGSVKRLLEEAHSRLR